VPGRFADNGQMRPRDFHLMSASSAAPRTPATLLALVASSLGVLFLVFSAALLPPLAVSLIYHDVDLRLFSTLFGAALAGGALMVGVSFRRQHEVSSRDGFLIVTLMWVTVSLIGALPFAFGLGMTTSDAIFESVSAFTTTGATVIVGLDSLPRSMLFYRQELQWLGGIGVILTAIALLPMLGVGGMQLLKAEVPGPVKDEKLTPRITHTARILWRVYLAITVACALLYWLAGMSPFDAIAHSLSTVSTGGFSTHDQSLGYFDSPAIEAVAIIFMLISGINFGLHFLFWRDIDLMHYWRSAEVRAFLGTILVVIVLSALVLRETGTTDTTLQAVRYAAIEVTSVITSTGFGVSDFSLWPLSLPALLIFISFIGGCAGSTAGGMKVIRFVILARQGYLEIERLVHPQSVRALKLQGRVVPDRVVQAVWGFAAVYVATFAIVMVLVMSDGLDQVTAFGAVATCLNNLGPGLGEVANNFVSVSDEAKWLFAVTMLLGRLEVFTILVLFSPVYWRN